MMTESDKPKSLRPYAPLILALWIAEVTGSFENSMILAAMKHLVADFGDTSLVGWLVTSYLIVGAAAAALVGRMGDIFGRRRMLLIMLAIAAIGSLLSAVSTNFTVLLIGRIMQGMTGAILALCVGLVRENLPPDRVPMGIGLMISGASIGTALGLVLGGVIVDHYSWHGIFFTSAAFCVTAFVGIYACVPKSLALPAMMKTDWFDGVVFAPGILALLFFVSNGEKAGWLAPINIAAAAIGATLLVYWWIRSLRSPNPLIDVRLFRNRKVLVANIVTALVSMSTLQIILVFSLMLQAPTWTVVGLGLSATVAGVAKIPSNLLSTFAGPLSGWLAGRGGGRMTMLAGGVLTTIGWIVAYVEHDSLASVIAALCVISFGATMLFAVGPTIVAASVPQDRTSEVSGMLTVTRQLFLGIGAQMVTTLLASESVVSATTGEKYPSYQAFQLAILVIIAFCIAATIISLALPKGKAVEGEWEK